MFVKAKPSTNSIPLIYLAFNEALVRLSLSNIAENLQIQSFRNETLTIASNDGIWLQELSFHAEEIKEIINSKFPTPQVSKLKYTIKEI